MDESWIHTYYTTLLHLLLEIQLSPIFHTMVLPVFGYLGRGPLADPRLECRKFILFAPSSSSSTLFIQRGVAVQTAFDALRGKGGQKSRGERRQLSVGTRVAKV